MQGEWETGRDSKITSCSLAKFCLCKHGWQLHIHITVCCCYWLNSSKGFQWVISGFCWPNTSTSGRVGRWSPSRVVLVPGLVLLTADQRLGEQQAIITPLHLCVPLCLIIPCMEFTLIVLLLADRQILWPAEQLFYYMPCPNYWIRLIPSPADWCDIDG